MLRVVEPELLDELPPDDPSAIQSRRDLQRVNSWMGHHGKMTAALRTVFSQKAPASLVEIGAGDGTFLLRIAQRLCPIWRGVEVTLLDRQNLVSSKTLEAFQALGWSARVIQADVFDWLAKVPLETSDAIVANLFLHHLSSSQLGALLAATLGHARAVVALEPRRARLPLLFSQLLWVIGCNQVTRHDAPVSVRAGFAAKELTALCPAGEWSLMERSAGLFSHLFVAVRKR